MIYNRVFSFFITNSDKQNLNGTRERYDWLLMSFVDLIQYSYKWVMLFRKYRPLVPIPLLIYNQQVTQFLYLIQLVLVSLLVYY
jgi:hypothetical protein